MTRLRPSFCGTFSLPSFLSERESKAPPEAASKSLLLHDLGRMASHRNPFPADKDWRKAVESLAVPQPARDANMPPLLKWNALPAWQRDNQYILAHYRPASYSYSGCFQSLFYLHNESVNIHVGGRLLAALIHSYPSGSNGMPYLTIQPCPRPQY